MKVLIRKLFADYILRFKELTNKFLCVIYRVPKVGAAVNNQIVQHNNKSLKFVFGIIAQIAALAWELVRRVLFAAVFVYLPYVIIAGYCPLVGDRKEAAVIYIFMIMCTVCGTLVNNLIMRQNKRNYMMAKIILVNPVIGICSNIFYRMVMDFVGFTLALSVMGVSLNNSIIMGFSTAFFRPMGEVFAVALYEKFRFIYTNRNVYNGCLMAMAMIIAYGMPVITRTVSGIWVSMVHPAFAVAAFIIGTVSLLLLSNYRHYYRLLTDTV